MKKFLSLLPLIAISTSLSACDPVVHPAGISDGVGQTRVALNYSSLCNNENKFTLDVVPVFDKPYPYISPNSQGGSLVTLTAWKTANGTVQTVLDFRGNPFPRKAGEPLPPTVAQVRNELFLNERFYSNPIHISQRVSKTIVCQVNLQAVPTYGYKETVGEYNYPGYGLPDWSADKKTMVLPGDDLDSLQPQ